MFHLKWIKKYDSLILILSSIQNFRTKRRNNWVALISKSVICPSVARTSKSTKVKDFYWLKFSVSMLKSRCLRSVNPHVLSAFFISRCSMVEFDLIKKENRSISVCNWSVQNSHSSNNWTILINTRYRITTHYWYNFWIWLIRPMVKSLFLLLLDFRFALLNIRQSIQHFARLCLSLKNLRVDPVNWRVPAFFPP